MGGAATVCATALAIARLKIPYVVFIGSLPVLLMSFARLQCKPRCTHAAHGEPPRTNSEQAGGHVSSFYQTTYTLDVLILQLSVYAMNGKSIEIDNTDAEGRLILSGGFCSTDSAILALRRLTARLAQTQSTMARASSSLTR